MIVPTKTELQLPVAQALALFVKVVRKISKRLIDIQKAAIGASIPEAVVAPASRVVGEQKVKTNWTPIETSLDDELNQAGNEATNALRERQREMIDSLDLSK
jgi:N-acetyltransferase 10